MSDKENIIEGICISERGVEHWRFQPVDGVGAIPSKKSNKAVAIYFNSEP